MNTFRDFDVDYLHAAIGFENDVVQYNRLQGTNLTFLYFKKTFWVDYPICVLEDAPWVGSKQRKLANWFLNFTTTQKRLNRLLDYGMRPIGLTDFSFTSNGTDITVAGVNVSITKNESVPLPELPINAVEALQVGWRNIKRPAYILILQDVSKDVTKSVSIRRTRWVFAKRALPVIPRVLEDRAKIELRCFSRDDADLKCGGSTDFNSTGPLRETRTKLLNFLDETITTSSQKKYCFLY